MGVFTVAITFFCLGALTGWVVWFKMPDIRENNSTPLSVNRKTAWAAIVELSSITAKARNDFMSAKTGDEILYERYIEYFFEVKNASKAFKNRYGKPTESEISELTK